MLFEQNKLSYLSRCFLRIVSNRLTQVKSSLRQMLGDLNPDPILVPIYQIVALIHSSEGAEHISVRNLSGSLNFSEQ